MKEHGTAAPPSPGWGGHAPGTGGGSGDAAGDVPGHGTPGGPGDPADAHPAGALEIFEAVVHSGGVATPYLRCGRGHPLLFLMDPRAGDVRDDPVLRILALGFLVIVPLPPGGLSDDPSADLTWIPPFLEGLGLESPAIVIRRHLD